MYTDSPLLQQQQQQQQQQQSGTNVYNWRCPCKLLTFHTYHLAASWTPHKMECTAEGQACDHSGDPFLLLCLQPSAKTYTLHGSRKALFEGMKHTNSLTIFRGTISAWAITPLCFSPPTFINFSLVVTSLTWEKIPGSPRFSVLQATESWAGPGNKAEVPHQWTSYMYTIRIHHCHFGTTWWWMPCIAANWRLKREQSSP